MTRGERLWPLGAAGVLGLLHLWLSIHLVEQRGGGGVSWGLLVLAGVLKLALMIALLRELQSDWPDA